jgi:hypothetical protein
MRFFEISHAACSGEAKDPGIINRQPRWIAGSSPAMTLCKSIIAPPHRLFRVNAVTMRRRILHRSGTGARGLHQFKTTLRIGPPQVRVR